MGIVSYLLISCVFKRVILRFLFLELSRFKISTYILYCAVVSCAGLLRSCSLVCKRFNYFRAQEKKRKLFLKANLQCIDNEVTETADLQEIPIWLLSVAWEEESCNNLGIRGRFKFQAQWNEDRKSNMKSSLWQQIRNFTPICI